MTGGQAYFPKSVDEVEELCKKIAHDLRNHYTIGYTPTNRQAGWQLARNPRQGEPSQERVQSHGPDKAGLLRADCRTSLQ